LLVNDDEHIGTRFGQHLLCDASKQQLLGDEGAMLAHDDEVAVALLLDQYLPVGISMQHHCRIIRDSHLSRPCRLVQLLQRAFTSLDPAPMNDVVADSSDPQFLFKRHVAGVEKNKVRVSADFFRQLYCTNRRRRKIHRHQYFPIRSPTWLLYDQQWSFACA